MGPAAGPSTPAEAAYGNVPTDLDEHNVVEVDANALRKAMGAAKQYDFAVPPPKEEVKIAANFWSRTTGAVEQHHKASSLQKRKHQINSLAADAAARSAEIAARGTKGMKSKKETAAKYGW